MARQQGLIAQRRAKLKRLRAQGIDPYPHRYHRTHTAAQANAAFLAWEQVNSGQAPLVRIAGRVTARRHMGKAAFLDLRDGSGKLQVYFKADELEDYPLLEAVDLGDFLGAAGPLFHTHSGEITVRAQEWTILAKALQPLPEKWHGLRDVELRYRHRHLDLIASESTRQTFLMRSRLILALRRFLDEQGFIEVETPILLPHAGGAMARPFSTHHFALDQDLYLRIATELHLKRLLIGGYERVYEIGRIFRNEGISTKHNPEFTTLESYQAYADYNDVMTMVEEMVFFLAQELLGTDTVTYQGHSISLRSPWRRIPLRQAIQEVCGIDFAAHPDVPSLAAAIRERGLPSDAPTRGKLIDHLIDQVEPTLIQPTFLLDYPVELSPLAKAKAGDEGLVERFEGFIGGMEVTNAFTELNDPLEQRQRFAHQLQLRSAGDEEAEMPDEDFLTALEYGMPPAGGLGMGIDRLVMLFTNQPSIREVILFPQMKSKE